MEYFSDIGSKTHLKNNKPRRWYILLLGFSLFVCGNNFAEAGQGEMSDEVNKISLAASDLYKDFDLLSASRENDIIAQHEILGSSANQDSLIARFPFTGNGNDGTFNEATLNVDRFGNAYAAYSLDYDLAALIK